MLERDYIMPLLHNSYMGDNNLVLPLTIPATEVAKSAIADGVFETDWRRVDIPCFNNLSRVKVDESVSESVGLALAGAGVVATAPLGSAVVAAPVCGAHVETQWKYLQYPTAGFVIQSRTVDGHTIYVNICAHRGVSDSTTNTGNACPFAVVSPPRELATMNDVPALAMTVVMHLKYVLRAQQSETTKESLSLAVLGMLNSGACANNMIQVRYSVPSMRSNYCGGTPLPFKFPANMPHSTSFADVTVMPTPCLCLQTAAGVDGIVPERELFINIVRHDEVPDFPERDPYLLLANLRRQYNYSIVDVAVHTSVWAAMETGDRMQDSVCRAVLAAVKLFLRDHAHCRDYVVLEELYRGVRVLGVEVIGAQRALTAPIDADTMREQAALRAMAYAMTCRDAEREKRRLVLSTARAAVIAGEKQVDVAAALLRLTGHHICMVGDVAQGQASSKAGRAECARLKQVALDFQEVERNLAAHTRSATKLQSSFRGYAQRRDMCAADSEVAGPILQLQSARIGRVAAPFKSRVGVSLQRCTDKTDVLAVEGVLNAIVQTIVVKHLDAAITSSMAAAAMLGLEEQAGRIADGFRQARLHAVCGRNRAARLRSEHKEWEVVEVARMERERVKAKEYAAREQCVIRLQSSFRGYALRQSLVTADADLVGAIVAEQSYYATNVALRFRAALDNKLVTVGAARYDAWEAATAAKAVSAELSEASWGLCDVAVHGIETSENAAVEMQVDRRELEVVDVAVARSKLAHAAAQRELSRLQMQADEYDRVLMEEEALLEAERQAQEEDAAADALVEGVVLTQQRRMHQDANVLREYISSRICDPSARYGERRLASASATNGSAFLADLVVIAGSAAMAAQMVPTVELRQQQSHLKQLIVSSRKHCASAAAEQRRLKAAAAEFALAEQIRVARQKREAVVFMQRHEGAIRLQSSFRGYAHRKANAAADELVSGPIIASQAARASSAADPFRTALLDRLDAVSAARYGSVLAAAAASDVRENFIGAIEDWCGIISKCRNYADKTQHSKLAADLLKLDGKLECTQGRCKEVEDDLVRLNAAAANAVVLEKQRTCRVDAARAADKVVNDAILLEQRKWNQAVSTHRLELHKTLQVVSTEIDGLKRAKASVTVQLKSPVGAGLAASQSSFGAGMHKEQLGPALVAVRRASICSTLAEAERTRLRRAGGEFVASEHARLAAEKLDASMFFERQNAAVCVQSRFRGHSHRCRMIQSDTIVEQSIRGTQTKRTAAVHIPFKTMMFGKLNAVCRTQSAIAEATEEIEEMKFFLRESTALLDGVVASAGFSAQGAATLVLEEKLESLYDVIDHSRQCCAAGEREWERLQRQATDSAVAESKRLERARLAAAVARRHEWAATRMQSRFRGFVCRRDNFAADSAVTAVVLSSQAVYIASVAAPFKKTVLAKQTADLAVACEDARNESMLISELAPSLLDVVSTAKFVSMSVDNSAVVRSVSCGNTGATQGSLGATAGDCELKRLMQMTRKFVEEEHQRVARTREQARESMRLSRAAASIQSSFRGHRHRCRMRASDTVVAEEVQRIQDNFTSGVAASFRSKSHVNIDTCNTRTQAAVVASRVAATLRDTLADRAQSLCGIIAASKGVSESCSTQEMKNTIASVRATVDRSLLRNALGEAELCRLKADAEEHFVTEQLRIETERRAAAECELCRNAATRVQTAYRGHAVRRDAKAADQAVTNHILAEQEEFVESMDSCRLVLFGEFNSACSGQSAVADCAAKAVQTSGELAGYVEYLRELIQSAALTSKESTAALNTASTLVGEIDVSVFKRSAGSAALERERLIHNRNCFVVAERERVRREVEIKTDFAEMQTAAVRTQSLFRGYRRRRGMAIADLAVTDAITRPQEEFCAHTAAPFRAAVLSRLETVGSTIAHMTRSPDAWKSALDSAVAAGTSTSRSIHLEPTGVQVAATDIVIHRARLFCFDADAECARLQLQMDRFLAIESKRLEQARLAAAVARRHEWAATRMQSRFRGFVCRRDNFAADSAVTTVVLSSHAVYIASVATPFQHSVRKELSSLGSVLFAASEASSHAAAVSAVANECSWNLCCTVLAATTASEAAAAGPISLVTTAVLRSRNHSATAWSEQARLQRNAELAAAEEKERVEMARLAVLEAAKKHTATVRTQSLFRGYRRRRGMAIADLAVTDAITRPQEEFCAHTAAPFRAALLSRLVAASASPLRSVVASVNRRVGAARTRLNHVVIAAEAAHRNIDMVRRVSRMSHLDNAVDHSRLCSAAAEAKASRLLSAHMGFLVDEAKRTGPRPAWDAHRTPAKLPQVPTRTNSGRAVPHASPTSRLVTPGAATGHISVRDTGLEQYLMFSPAATGSPSRAGATPGTPQQSPAQPQSFPMEKLTVDTDVYSPTPRAAVTTSERSLNQRSAPQLHTPASQKSYSSSVGVMSAPGSNNSTYSASRGSPPNPKKTLKKKLEMDDVQELDVDTWVSSLTPPPSF